jgi:cobalt-precorrin-5B (C1)-methyltransferase
MGDFAAAVLKYLRRHPIDRLTIVGGFAKLSKLAAGHLDLHSGRSQVSVEHLTSLAAAAGHPLDLADCNTGLEALHRAQASSVPLADLVASAAADEALAVLREAPVVVDVICIDRAGTIVGRCEPRSR